MIIPYKTHLRVLDSGEYYIELSEELVNRLKWSKEDALLIEETEICEDWGEHFGFTVANITINPKAQSD
tara:strand:- start:926 stop:1132 length:207 start_codon:yes stop_codon:yes gene_type:complete